MDRSAHLAYLSELARKGFTVASLQYRTSNETPFPGPLEDVKAGIRYLRAHAGRFHIDPEKIGVMGESAGGYLTCMAALATDPSFDVERIWNIPAVCRQPAPGIRPQTSEAFLMIQRNSARQRRNHFSLERMLCVSCRGSIEMLSGELCDSGSSAFPDHSRKK